MPELPAPSLAGPPVAAIVLAAGQGSRMKSALHKVLHPIAGKAMVLHLLDSLAEISPARTIVVVGQGRDQVEAALGPRGVEFAVQAAPRGTGDAVRAAQDVLSDFDGDIVVLFGDTPLVEAATIARLRAALTEDVAVAVLGFRPDDPAAYGRIIADGGEIRKMVEFKDASAAERAVTLCNSGLLAVRARDLWALLARIGNANAAGEYYLPDIVGLAIADGRRCVVIETGADKVAGVNSRADLAAVEASWQARRRAAMMAAGVTLVDPGSVFFAHDTQIAADVTIEPFVVFGPGVGVESGAVIHSHSHIEGALVGAGASVGPFARLRPGTRLGVGAKVGNFVEVKAADIGAGAKASHLTYLGDCTVGAGANIGAGTITCNYDGFFKYRTVIGAGAFIGSNSALVAPVTIGDGAYVGAGSIVTRDIAADALGLVRADQTEKPGWAARFRAAMTARKRG
ncbi:bifunctional N-acetylglucosamine-1-phosphate uridyltransferase/glucosamine-1-phosphate acetyltransferase [alpha proteobacterium AAP81b]|nr:bifunctional N-acetylglucosamine-1-phosphate uridyltransferase/glucosamine-1-phosphate acetyltransferase [alpha proteobacterium AAP81b]